MMPIVQKLLPRTRLVDWLKAKNATLLIQEYVDCWRVYIEELSGPMVDGATPFEAVAAYCKKISFRQFFWRRDNTYWRAPCYPQLPDEAPYLTITKEELEAELL